MMTTEHGRQFVQGQRQDWNRVASAWEKWDRLFEEQTGVPQSSVGRRISLPIAVRVVVGRKPS